MDTEIQERTGKSIQNIIIHDGEEEFHQLELNVIQDLVSKKKCQCHCYRWWYGIV